MKPNDNEKTVSAGFVRLQYGDNQFRQSDIVKIRGFLAAKYPENEQIHNHADGGKFRYVYPEIQFKFLQGRMNIIGYGAGKEILMKIFQEVDSVEIFHRLRDIPQKEIHIYDAEIGVSEQPYKYQFLTPWMALNQGNYKLLNNLPFKEWKPKLDRILWGNLKTIAHAFDYWIEDPDEIQVDGDFRVQSGHFKGNEMITFTGHFTVNFLIPLFLGLGKQVARGYGAVVYL